MKGGVIGLSVVGEPLLPESSVRPGPGKVASDTLLVTLVAVVKGTEGALLVGLSIAENRLFVRAVVRAEGADLRFMCRGELEKDWSSVCGGGLLRDECLLPLVNLDS